MRLFSRLFSKRDKEGKIKAPLAEPVPGFASDSSAERGGTKLRRPGADKREAWTARILPTWQPGEVILDRYEVEDVITTGGMGLIYVTRHRDWKVRIAIKSPTEEMLAEAEYFVRVTREAEAWTALGLHPNIAYCYFVRNIEKVPHVFIEYADGGNLQRWVEKGLCADLKVGLDLAIQFCHGMVHAHGKGMIHRDINPRNILLTQDGTLKITDFGIARWGGKEESPAIPLLRGGDASKTMGFIGTYDYASPEQWRDAHAVGPETDIFSFGVCLWEMLCGRRPYTIAAAKEALPDLRYLRPDLPARLHTLLEQLVAFEVEARQALGGFAELKDQFSALYHECFGEPSPHSVLEQVDLEADGLNNQGVSYWELRGDEEAVTCFQRALKRDPTHPQATYNLCLIDWRAGHITEDVAVNRLEDRLRNPTIAKATVAPLLARLHMDQRRPDEARKVLKEFPGCFEELFGKQSLTGEGWYYAPLELCPPRGYQELSTEKQQLESLCNEVDKLIRSDRNKEAFDCLLHGFEKAGLVSDLGKRYRSLYARGKPKGIAWRDEFFLQSKGSNVISVSFSPDGRRALSGSWDNTLRLWDLKTRQCVVTLPGHTGLVDYVCCSPDGRLELSWGGDNNIRRWDHMTQQCLATLTGGHTSSVSSVCFSPDGRRALSGSVDHTLRLWDLETRQCAVTLAGHTGWVNSVCFSPDGCRALSAGGGEDHTLRLWDVEAHQCLATLTGHTSSVSSVCFSPDGRRALSGSVDHTVRLWDLETRQCLATLTGHTSVVNSVCFSPDGRWVLSGSGDKTIRLWDIETRQCLAILEGHTGPVTSVCVSPNGVWVLSAGHDHTLRLWRIIWDLEFPDSDR